MEPSEKERNEHNKHHEVFRTWCPKCVPGKGKSMQHKRDKSVKTEDEKAGEVPIVKMITVKPDTRTRKRP